jgi:hypothetical protein
LDGIAELLGPKTISGAAALANLQKQTKANTVCQQRDQKHKEKCRGCLCFCQDAPWLCCIAHDPDASKYI